MPKLTAQQVAGVVSAMGAPSGTTVAQWVEKARQESGFRTDVEDFLGSGHWGLWQISEQHIGKAGTSSVENLKDPYGNFAVAKALYAESGWRPWAASGGKPNPSQGSRAAAATPTPPTQLPGATGSSFWDDLPGGDLIEDTAGAINRGVQVVVDAAAWITDVHNVTRVLYVAGGIALGVVALSIIAKPVVTDVAKTVKPV